MEQKDLIATIRISSGTALVGEKQMEIVPLAKLYNDSGIDKLFIFDLSGEDLEHDRNIHAIKELCRNIEIPVWAGGNIKRLEDIKKLLYAGCSGVMLNGSKQETEQLAEEGAKRFGRERIALTLQTVDLIFKHPDLAKESVSELVILNPKLIDTIENVTELPCNVVADEFDAAHWCSLLQKKDICGIFGQALDNPDTDIMTVKKELAALGAPVETYASAIAFDQFKLNGDGLIPVIVQDYQTLEVLMLAYMNRESFEQTLATGKMTYFSRSRKKLWMKGETSGHYQYVKSLTLDCDNDTILAKVSQIGAACHTGSPTCFFQELMAKEYEVRNPLKIFEKVYGTIADRKENPKEGSYTNYLFDKGIDKILKKVGEEATEIVIAAKNPDAEEIKYEISDFLYHVMVLMVEKGVTWEDIAQELAQR